MPTVVCPVCKQEYFKKYVKKNSKNICSIKCSSIYNTKLIETKCEYCNVVKLKPPSQIYAHTFCSSKCAGKYNAQFIPPPKKIEVTCELCNNKFYRKPINTIRRIDKTVKPLFCTRICKGKYDAAKGKGVHDPFFIKSKLRSELEIYIEQKILYFFPYLQSSFNNRVVLENGTELDVYFPDLNFAIEINGICHYKDIYGNKQSIKTFKKDEEKIRICKQKYITLMIIKSTERFYPWVGDYHWNFINTELLKLIPYCENVEEPILYKPRKVRNELPIIYYNTK